VSTFDSIFFKFGKTEERKAVTASGFSISDAPTESSVILVLIAPPPGTSDVAALYEVASMPMPTPNAQRPTPNLVTEMSIPRVINEKQKF
jgi:hypothetical protein